MSTAGNPKLRQALQDVLQGPLEVYAACPNRKICGKQVPEGGCSCCGRDDVHTDLCNNINPFRFCECWERAHEGECVMTGPGPNLKTYADGMIALRRLQREMEARFREVVRFAGDTQNFAPFPKDRPARPSANTVVYRFDRITSGRHRPGDLRIGTCPYLLFSTTGEAIAAWFEAVDTRCKDASDRILYWRAEPELVWMADFETECEARGWMIYSRLAIAKEGDMQHAINLNTGSCRACKLTREEFEDGFGSVDGPCPGPLKEPMLMVKLRSGEYWKHPDGSSFMLPDPTCPGIISFGDPREAFENWKRDGNPEAWYGNGTGPMRD